MKEARINPESLRNVICCDFDGVLHSYISRWTRADVIPDPPTPGAIEWLNMIAADGHYTVVIQSTRANESAGQSAIRNWLLKYGYDRAMDVKITGDKPPALLYIDDRALLFTGNNFPSLRKIAEFRPWNFDQRLTEAGRAAFEAELEEARHDR